MSSIRADCHASSVDHPNSEHPAPPELHRRAFLAAAGAAGVLGLAGCVGDIPVGVTSDGPLSGVDNAQPAVVQIVARGSFVHPQVGPTPDVAGRGSGFVIDPSGVAVTNNHVVTGAATLEVFVGGDDTTSYNARVLGVSECSDLAVIQISTQEDLPYLEWYDGEVRPNLDVWSLGFPLGDPEYTVTRGIVSKADADGDHDWASVDYVVEHDARIRGGNSGGPLVEEGGRVVGVNYASNERTDQNFAIGARLAERIVEQLRSEEDVNSLGINGQAVRSEDGSLSGVWVASVESGSPAWNAGIRPADIILRMENFTLATDGTMADYCDVLRSRTAEDVLVVQVLRYPTGQLYAGEINGKPLQQVIVDVPVETGDGTGGGGSAAYTNYRQIADDTGAIQVQVPAEWADVSGTPIDIGPSVLASPNIQAYADTFTTPGVQVVATTELGSDPDAILDLLAIGGCTDLGRDDYDDGFHTGRFQVFDACGGTRSAIVNVAAFPTDGSYALLMQAQLVEDRDVEALTRIIGSVRVEPSRV